MPDCPFDQSQEEWLFTHFMRKHAASIWFGVITLLLTGFIVASGLTVSRADTATTAAATVSTDLQAHMLKQANREGGVDATLKSINETLLRIDKYMETHK